MQRFPIRKHAKKLFVPVRIEAKEHTFLVDTSSEATVFDHSLPLGDFRSIDTITSGKGDTVYVKNYDPPDARVGVLPLKMVGAGGVLSHDLTNLSDNDYEGILGINFLGQYVLHLDFDRGQMLFLNSVPAGAGESLPMFWDADQIPQVIGAVTGGDPVKFWISTGLSGFDSGTLMGQEIKGLTAKGTMSVVNSVRYASASGLAGTASQHQGRFLAVGPFGVERPVFTEIPACNMLGLHFWSRFTVTFDFPGRRVFLRKGANYARADVWNRSGLHWIVKAGTSTVDAVDDDSPASTAGVRVGDVLLEIGGMKLGEAAPFQVAERLWHAGRIDCLIRRGSETLRLTVSVPERNQ